METTEGTPRTEEDRRNLRRMLRSALREFEACDSYAAEAREVGDPYMASFFEWARSCYAEIGGRAGELLDERRVRFGSAPAQGDPADLSSGQDVAEPEG